jgi:hypothetical protein
MDEDRSRAAKGGEGNRASVFGIRDGRRGFGN